jgi:hypothetical protein
MAARGRGAPPYVGAVDELTTAPTAKSDDELAPATAHPRWIRPLACYERRETTLIEGTRYG